MPPVETVGRRKKSDVVEISSLLGDRYSPDSPTYQRQISSEHPSIESIPEENDDENKVEGEGTEEAREDEKPESMKKRLVKVFSLMNVFRTSFFGMQLSRFCSLVQSTDNPDLV